MTRVAKTKKTSRLSLEISVELREEIEAFRDQLDADSITEVIRRSVKFAKLMHNSVAKGSTVIIRSVDGDENIVAVV